MRSYLVAGNWKMNGSQAATADLLEGIVSGFRGSETVEMLVCPPFPYLAAAAEKLDGTHIALGAQNVSEYGPGAYTGETAASMLKDVGCSYAIVGHSERRAMFGESSTIVAGKFRAALASGLTPILCVGETLDEREANRTKAVIDEQLDAVLDATGVAAFAGAVIAYEPVWAIGTGKTASPAEAQEVHAHIRGRLNEKDQGIAMSIKILYGGSVKGDNAEGLFSMADIDGGLIGGASLKAQDFLAIAEAAAACN